MQLSVIKPGMLSKVITELYAEGAFTDFDVKPEPRRLELGSGHRPTRGYEHNDLYPWDHIEHVGPAWMIDLPDDSLDEVLALAFIEHLTYYEALDTFRNVHRMLKPGGLFLFDVPDYPKWCEEYLLRLRFGGGGGADQGPSLDDCRRTLFGWGRWPGDEHKYGWDWDHLKDALKSVGFHARPDENPFQIASRTHRDRFADPANAHLYVVATK